MTTPRVVITRADDDAASWQSWFGQHAIATYHVPFLRMQTVVPDGSWARWWDRVGTGDAEFFVSAQAVRSAVHDATACATLLPPPKAVSPTVGHAPRRRITTSTATAGPSSPCLCLQWLSG